MMITGAVMAGGASRRFGRPKAFASWQGSRFYEKAVSALKTCDEVVLSVREDQLMDFTDFKGRLVTDLAPYQSCGPLGGLYALMKQTDGDAIMTLPCDMPLFEQEDAEKLQLLFKNSHDIQALIPSVHGKLQPLSAIYSLSCLPVIEEYLESGNYRMRSFFDHIKWREVSHTDLGISEEAFSNINDQQAYEQLTRNAQRRTMDGTD
ncbi:molybdenum cofactor guanylyltransferase [Jeotgalibacillus salarius]|uniref:Probable molybdenum cofactor guanylyltransferase n=1 Tax=Jeotgalibacillus salarius TaxID=546023 RepID=A0A4Y8LIB3_9BACL|nr:molybdenum cofactor guanylyltransferase [Jeotgalibacillus salarius]TFE02111.1 molybdenum cofactor guanylyltransferase [Jeotgalibacillus salarius]